MRLRFFYDSSRCFWTEPRCFYGLVFSVLEADALMSPASPRGEVGGSTVITDPEFDSVMPSSVVE